MILEVTYCYNRHAKKDSVIADFSIGGNLL
jgi:hypothetical protein